MKRNEFLKYLALLPMTGTSLNQLTKLTSQWSSTEKMPVLFVGHGNPMNAILENEFTNGWRAMVNGLQPKAILCISAHWMTKGTLVTMAPKPKTIHDFGGFPPALHAVQYPALGAPEIAKELIQTIKKFTVEEDHEWGLDHGTWSVLVKMFPNADVPVFQMSLNYLQKPQDHYDLGKELYFLRHKGVLIVGSGNIIQCKHLLLREIDFRRNLWPRIIIHEIIGGGRCKFHERRSNSLRSNSRIIQPCYV